MLVTLMVLQTGSTEISPVASWVSARERFIGLRGGAAWVDRSATRCAVLEALVTLQGVQYTEAETAAGIVTHELLGEPRPILGLDGASFDWWLGHHL